MHAGLPHRQQAGRQKVSKHNPTRQASASLIAFVSPSTALPLQEPLGRVPTWARQAWKRLAVARPHLCLELLQELWGRVKASYRARGSSPDRYTAFVMVSLTAY